MIKKRNQISIFLVAVLMMLTVYYVNINHESLPVNSTDNQDLQTAGFVDDNSKSNEQVRSAVLATLRLDLQTQRELRINSLNSIISSDTDIETKSDALTTLNEINVNTENELLLEDKIITLGYSDAFVHIDSDAVSVTVISDKHTVSSANEIILLTKSEIGDSFSVTLYFQNESTS